MVNAELRILFINGLLQQISTLIESIEIVQEVISNKIFRTAGFHFITRATSRTQDFLNMFGK